MDIVRIIYSGKHKKSALTVTAIFFHLHTGSCAAKSCYYELQIIVTIFTTVIQRHYEISTMCINHQYSPATDNAAFSFF